jgi:hypothetical protein
MPIDSYEKRITPCQQIASGKPELTRNRIFKPLNFHWRLSPNVPKLPLVEARKSSSGKVVWTFELTDEDENAIIQKFHTNGLVEASQFYNELKTLRSMTYSL